MHSKHVPAFNANDNDPRSFTYAVKSKALFALCDLLLLLLPTSLRLLHLQFLLSILITNLFENISSSIANLFLTFHVVAFFLSKDLDPK